MTKTDDTFMTIDEATEFLKISKSQLEKLIGLSIIPVSRLNTSVRIHRESLLKFMLDQCGNATQKLMMRDFIP